MTKRYTISADVLYQVHYNFIAENLIEARTMVEEESIEPTSMEQVTSPILVNIKEEEI